MMNEWQLKSVLSHLARRSVELRVPDGVRLFRLRTIGQKRVG